MHQSVRLNYCKERCERSAPTEVCSCNYFAILCDAKRYSPGNFWHTRSTLRVSVLGARGVNVKSFVWLKALIKKLTIGHAKKKLDTLSCEEIHEGSTRLLLGSNGKDLQCKIGEHCNGA